LRGDVVRLPHSQASHKTGLVKLGRFSYRYLWSLPLKKGRGWFQHLQRGTQPAAL
jgi:hypothetical protein